MHLEHTACNHLSLWALSQVKLLHRCCRPSPRSGRFKRQNILIPCHRLPPQELYPIQQYKQLQMWQRFKARLHSYPLCPHLRLGGKWVPQKPQHQLATPGLASRDQEAALVLLFREHPMCPYPKNMIHFKIRKIKSMFHKSQASSVRVITMVNHRQPARHLSSKPTVAWLQSLQQMPMHAFQHWSSKISRHI